MAKVFQTISPIDGSVYVERNYATEVEIEQVLKSASLSNMGWKNSTLQERAKVCHKVIDYFLEHTVEMAKELTMQMGRPIRFTPFEIKGGFVERAQYMIDRAADSLQDVQVDELDGFTRFIRKEPLGTILVLAPWNYPYLTSVNVIIPAIMSGNSVILKHAEQTPLCAERYAEAFKFAGAPEGVFQYLHVSHKQIQEIIEDERIDHVAFTGSVEGGHAVQSAVAKRFIGLGLELGGKDPAYVRADADLDQAVENLVDGAFFNSGQSCCSIERIYVHESNYDEFVKLFVDLAKTYVIGDPLEEETMLGPMVKKEAADKAVQHINDALSKGAKALIEPNHFSTVQAPYFNPQVLVGVNHDMLIMKEESFAPIIGIMPVSNDEEAIALMNDSKYGLTASVWTKEESKAIEIGEQVQTGTWFMNRCDYLDPALAWTGVKNSGRGCTLSALGYDQLTRPKSYHLKK